MNRYYNILILFTLVNGIIHTKPTHRHKLEKEYKKHLSELKKKQKSKTAYQPAATSLKNIKQKKNFTIGPSFGLPQTQYHTAATCYNPNNIRALLHTEAKKQKKPYQWLCKQRWYVISSLPDMTCHSCKKKVNFLNCKDLPKSAQDNLLLNVTSNLFNPDLHEITITECPYCQSNNIKTSKHQYKELNKHRKNAINKQLKHLLIDKQHTSDKTPVSRVSVEIADLLHPGTDHINQAKLKELASFIKECGNPILFIHHSTNPASKTYLFDHPDDAEWFANISAQIAEACTTVTHVCPMNQPLAVALRVPRGHQPPFKSSLHHKEFVNAVEKAHLLAAQAVKRVRPDIKVLISHQWKLFYPQHSGKNWQYIIEKLGCKIAHRIYNKRFIQMCNKHKDVIDGIALSTYPRIYCNKATVVGDNCTGILDPESVLYSLYNVHKSFPDKDIYLVETGCNTTNQEVKKAFIDMTLHVCNIAHDMNIPIKTCLFWGLNDDPYFYREWNKAPGSTHFGFYKDLNIKNPTLSITPYGAYLRETIQKAYSHKK